MSRLTRADRERIRAEVKELAKQPRGEITFPPSSVGFAKKDQDVIKSIGTHGPLGSGRLHPIETEQETDGRWIAAIPSLTGVMAYGETESDARTKAYALAQALGVTYHAECIARKAHAGQTEPSTGYPYICHVERVVAMVEGPAEKATAWLHDVIEDSDLREEDLAESGIPADIVEAVELLTREPNRETYAEYIGRIKRSGNSVAIAVKVADLQDHLGGNCPASLVTRYSNALKELKGDAQESARNSRSPRS